MSASRPILRFPRARTGEGTFADYYHAHERMVRSILYSLAPREDVDDLVQQVFLKSWQARGQFEGRAKVSTWLASIAVNAARDCWRQRKGVGTPVALDDLAPLHDERADAAQRGTEARLQIEGAMAGLSFEHRTVIALRYYEDMTVPEIAESLGEPEGTVKSRLHYAKEHLRARLLPAERLP